MRFNSDAGPNPNRMWRFVFAEQAPSRGNNDGKSRNFSYEAVVNNRNRNVSDIRYDWRGDWEQQRQQSRHESSNGHVPPRSSAQ